MTLPRKTVLFNTVANLDQGTIDVILLRVCAITGVYNATSQYEPGEITLDYERSLFKAEIDGEFDGANIAMQIEKIPDVLYANPLRGPYLE